MFLQIFQAEMEMTSGTFFPPTLVIGAQVASPIFYEEVGVLLSMIFTWLFSV